MEKKTIVNGIGYLSNLYPSALKDIDYETMVNVWTDFFKDIPDEVFTKVIRDYSGSTFPNAPKLRACAKEYMEKDQPKAEDKWLEVIDAIHKYGSSEQNVVKHLDEYTAYIMKLVGYRNICMAEEQTWNKKEFIGEYNANKEYKRELLNNQKQLENNNLKLESIIN